ncbi:hypothetical protein K501DRAFT_270461 [Backusella circina FSU 941]|nr:hypothetical protein K501DRAFT_270461 [Backusella circina FSU 941]
MFWVLYRLKLFSMSLPIWIFTTNLNCQEFVGFEKSLLEQLELYDVNIVDTVLSDKNGLFLDYIILKFVNIDRFEFLPTFKSEWLNKYTHSTDCCYGIVLDYVVYVCVCALLNCSHAYTIGKIQFHIPVKPTWFPDTIKVLKMKATPFDNIVPSLKGSEVSPSESVFADATLSSTVFNKSKDFAFLGSLVFLNSLNTSVDPVKNPYNVEKIYTFISRPLKKLDMNVRKKTTTVKVKLFEPLLFSYPNLHELRMHSFGSTIVLSQLKRKFTYHKLRKLELINCNIKNEVIDFVCQYTPNVKELAWTVTSTNIAEATINPKMEFKTTLFWYKPKGPQTRQVVFIYNDYSENLYVEIKTLKRTARYMLRVTNKGIVNKVKDVTHKLKGTPLDLSRVIFVCDDLDTLNMNQHSDSLTIESHYW